MWESARWGLPTLAWGQHSALVLVWAMSCAWPCALLVWTLTHRLNFLFDLRPTLSVWSCPCHHGLAWQSLQCCLIQVIATSPAMFLKGAPLLMLMSWCCHPWLASLWGVAHSFWQMGPLVFWKLYLWKQYYRVLKSQSFNRNQCWLCTLYPKISSKTLIFCINQETFLKKLVIQQNALSGIYMSGHVAL